jgi:hypothetical protein
MPKTRIPNTVINKTIARGIDMGMQAGAFLSGGRI